MLDIIWNEIKGMFHSRLFPMSIIFFLLFFSLIHRIFTMQIIHGDEYAKKATITSERDRDIKSTRGNIYDRNGVLLAYDALSYSVNIEDVGAFSTNEEKNAMIDYLISMIEEHGDSIVTDFPISLNKDGSFSFTVDGNSLMRFKKDMYSVSSSAKLSDEQIAATADDMFDYIRYSTDIESPRFSISDTYSKEEALKIMAIRYELYLNRFQKYVQSTIASDISEKTVAALNEASADLPGVEVIQETHRVYNDSKYFAHILGYTGTITNEEYQALSDEEKEKYTKTDQIGKTGLEKEYEEYLHGEKGSEKLVINENYRVVDMKDRVEPVAGNNLYLTIDATMQEKYYDLLEKKLASILLSKITNSMDYGSKGTSSDDILIPIYEVYNALIENNIVDINQLNDKDATDNEKTVYQKYLAKQEDIFTRLDQTMAADSTITNKDAGIFMEDYLDYIYSYLQEQKVLVKASIDKEDSMYLDYINNKVSLSAFLQYALSNSWIDLSKLSIGDDFYSTKELYQELVTYIKDSLASDKTFNKMIYKTLIFNYSLSGKEICLLLFDQGVLEYDESDIDRLRDGTLSAYEFICQKIQNLEITPGELALEPCSGSIVVTDVNTGEVRALVSYPSYDNNKLANRIEPVYYSYLQQNQASPLLNRPMQQKTAPGSTFKMVTSVAALEEGVVGQRETILDKGVFEKIPQGPRCWSRTSHGSIDITDALQVSCNYFFYEMGWRLSKSGDTYDSTLGLSKLKKYATMFGLNDKSGIELYEYEPHISDKDSIRSSIGQGTNSFTPAQINRYVTAVANKGTCYNLTIIGQVKSLDGTVLLDNKASVFNQIEIQASTWSLVQEGMYKVVNGPRSSILSLFKNLGVTVAGKTGTAQESKSHPNHALFVSFAPYDNPEIAVVVVIPNGYTSGNAAEVARNVYKSYFKASSNNADTNDTAEEAAFDSNSVID
ncbi:MAG: penicillin-binding protein 2 [Clostridiales bacterium]|nr:penicillin-binding protein 2 [Clostridiales bacterium]